MHTRSSLALAALLALAACQTPPAPPPTPPGALAQPVAAKPESDDPAWNWRVAPYLWAASVNGNMTVADRKLDVDMSFGDILDDLNYSIQGVVEAHKGQWGVL